MIQQEHSTPCPRSGQFSKDPLGSLRDLIVEYVTRRDFTSFVELQRHVDEAGYESRGETSLTIGNPNFVVWADLSASLAEAVESLLRDKILYLHPCSSLVYLSDDAMLDLPVAKRPPKGGYRKPHWVPATLRIVPF